MAASSSEPFSGQGRRVAPVRTAASGMAALPLDALSDILLRLPAKDLCRLRLVCRSWRSLLSDPHFAAAYAARHPEPLIILASNNTRPSEAGGDGDGDSWTRPMKYESVISVMDLSGQVLKQVRVDGHVASVSLGLACVKRTGDGSCRLVNAATGAAHRVPEEDPAYGYSNRLCLFGQVAGAREIKVLRMVLYSLHGNRCVLYEICTVGRSRAAAGVLLHVAEEQWRVVQDPPRHIDWCEKASGVIDGVVFFLTKDDNDGVEQDCGVVSFDLETELWRPTIRGPRCTTVNEENNGQVQNDFSLVNLNGSLVVVHLPSPCMDLWYLLDFEKSLWAKQYSIQIEDYDCSLMAFRPLIILEDGRIVIDVQGTDTLEIYDPRTNSLSTVAETELSCSVSVYTGTLLSLEW